MAQCFQFIILLIFQKIIYSCYKTCETCSQNSISMNNQFCVNCKENAYLMDGTQNCYYLYEQPNYYIDNITQTFKKCTFPCYECLDDSTNHCISCEKGYFYNLDSNLCEKCNSEYYIYTMDGSDKCKKNNGINNFCNLKISECTEKAISEDIECPREYPLLLITSTQKECTFDYLSNQNSYQISNRIIKTQWINNFIQIGDGGSVYMSIDNNKGDLIIESNIYTVNSKSERFFYGIQGNGRPLFYVQENNKFSFQKKMFSYNGFKKYESQLIYLR